MKRILFLDIDGVLNSKSSGTIWSSLNPEKYGLCDKCFQQVKRILTSTNSDIVWITSWRNHDINFVWHFEYCGKEYEFKSPLQKAMNYFSNFKQDVCDHLTKRNKSTDISYYLKSRNLNNNNCKFAILDDDITQGFDEEFSDHYFRCFSENGVDEKLADSIIKYLS